MDTLLVVGAESTVGANIAVTLADEFDVVGLSRTGQVDLDGCRVISCDFGSGELARWIEDLEPAWIVLAGAVSGSSWDEADVPSPRLAAEPRLAAAVAAAAGRIGASLTYLSTDAVFAGPQMFHAEDSSTCSANPLAESALAAEAAVIGEATSSRKLIVRTHAYGWSPAEHPNSFAERCCEALCGGAPISADAHRHATPILASDLAGLLHAAHRAELQGVVHIAGAERANPRRLAHELATMLGLPGPRQFALAETTWQRTKETSLLSRSFQQATGQALPMLREGLRRFAAQMENGHRDRLRSEEQTLAPAKAA